MWQFPCIRATIPAASSRDPAAGNPRHAILQRMVAEEIGVAIPMRQFRGTHCKGIYLGDGGPDDRGVDATVFVVGLPEETYGDSDVSSEGRASGKCWLPGTELLAAQAASPYAICPAPASFMRAVASELDRGLPYQVSIESDEDPDYVVRHIPLPAMFTTVPLLTPAGNRPPG